MARVIPTAVGDRMRKFREEHNLTQTALAERAMFAVPVVNQIESGKVRLSIDRALQLEKATPGITAEDWLQMQLNDEVLNAREILNQPKPEPLVPANNGTAKKGGKHGSNKQVAA